MPRVARAKAVANAIVGAKRGAEEANEQQQLTEEDDDSADEAPALPVRGPDLVNRLVVGTKLYLLQPDSVEIDAFQTPRFEPLRSLVQDLVTTPGGVGWGQQRGVQLPSAGVGKPTLSIWAKKLDEDNDTTLRFRFDNSRSSTGFGIDALIRKLGTVTAASEDLQWLRVSEFLEGGFLYATRCSDGFEVKLLLDRDHEDRIWSRKPPTTTHKPPPSPAPPPAPPAAPPPQPAAATPPPQPPPTQPQTTPDAAADASWITPMALDERLEALLAKFDARVDANEVVASDYAKHVEVFFKTNNRPPNSVETQTLLNAAHAERMRTTKIGDVTREEVLKLLLELRSIPAQVTALEERVAQ